MVIKLLLGATSLGRAATVVGDGSYVHNGADFETDGLDGTYGRLTAGAGALNAYFNLLKTVAHSLTASVLANNLTGISGALTAALEVELAGGGPTDYVALKVCHAHDGVVESGGDVNDTGGNVLAALSLEDLYLVIVISKTELGENVAANFRLAGLQDVQAVRQRPRDLRQFRMQIRVWFQQWRSTLTWEL